MFFLDRFELSDEKLLLLIEYHLNDLLSSFLEAISEFSNEFNIYMLDMSFMMTPHEEEWKKVKKKVSEDKEDRFFHLKDFIAWLKKQPWPTNIIKVKPNEKEPK